MHQDNNSKRKTEKRKGLRDLYKINQGSAESKEFDPSGILRAPCGRCFGFVCIMFFIFRHFLNSPPSEKRELKGSKREKEILFRAEAPPTGGAILMFSVLLACAARSPCANSLIVAEKAGGRRNPRPPENIYSKYFPL